MVALKAQYTAFNNGKATGNMAEYKQCSYSLRKAIKQAKRQYIDKVESQGSETRHMWQGLQTITDYKRKTSHIAETDVLPLDRLNTLFARFEDSTVPPTRPAIKDCGLSFSVTDVSKTLAGLLAQTASLAASSEHVQTSWLVCLRTYSISIPVCCPHMLQDDHHYYCTQESEGN